MNMPSRCRYTSMQRRAEKRERGSLLVQFAVMLSVLVAILGVVDIGYMYYAKRDLQRIADLAALEAAGAIQRSSEGDTEKACKDAGKKSIFENWPVPVGRVASLEEVVCGNWSSSLPGPRHFSKNGALNAAHVLLQGRSPTFFPGNWSRLVTAEAIAKTDIPVAAFSVESQLAQFNKKSPLGMVLSTVGLSADQLTLLDSQGLAKVAITPAGLLELLGVDLGVGGLTALTPQGVAKLENLTLLNVLDASLEAVQDQTLQLQLDALVQDLLKVKVGGVRLVDMKMMQGINDPNGLFAFLSLGSDAAPDNAALNVNLGVGELLKTAIGVGLNGHAVDVPNLNLLGLIQVQASVVEPPSIAVGGEGVKAKTSQVRLTINIDSKNLLILGPLLDAGGKGLRIHLPISIEAVSAEGVLNKLHCTEAPPKMDVEVTSRVARISIGNPGEAMITVAGVERVFGAIRANLLQQPEPELLEGLLVGEYELLSKGQPRYEDYWTLPNQLALGDTLESLTSAVFALLSGINSPPALPSGWEVPPMNYGNATEVRTKQIETLVSSYLEETKVNGFYNVDAASKLVLNGRAETADKPALDKLLTSNFSFPNAIPVSCLLGSCPTSAWKTGSFEDAFHSYTSVPYGVLDVVGIPTLGNGFQSCAGLLSSLLNWNGCVKHNLNKLVQDHYGYANLSSSGSILSALNGAGAGVACPGALCVLLKPVLESIKWLLNGLGTQLLAPLVNSVLGVELGRVNVRPIHIQCGTAQLVF